MSKFGFLRSKLVTSLGFNVKIWGLMSNLVKICDAKKKVSSKAKTDCNSLESAITMANILQKRNPDLDTDHYTLAVRPSDAGLSNEVTR